METDVDALEMHFLLDRHADKYMPLMHLLNQRHVDTFIRLVKHAMVTQPTTFNINRRVSFPEDKTFLDKACSDDLPRAVEFLLIAGADPNLVNTEHDRAPIHFACESRSIGALQALLKEPSTQRNLIAGGLTPLHFAVKVNCPTCVRMLLEASASPNIPNNRGLTPIHCAADHNDRAIVQIFLEYSYILDLDSLEDMDGETPRRIIERKFPDLKIPETSVQLKNEELLRYYLVANDEANFIKILETIEDISTLENTPELLFMAVEQKLKAAMRKLIELGAMESTDLFELGEIAVRQAYPELLLEVLKRNDHLANRLLMPASQELGTPKRSRNKALACYEVFRIILNQPGIDVHQEDDKSNSPLHYAARADNQKAMKLLLKKGSYIGHLNDYGIPPLANMSTELLQNHFDACISSSNERTEDFEIVIDYRNFVPHNISHCVRDDPEQKLHRETIIRHTQDSCSETDALLYMSQHSGLKTLLKHPIIASFLYVKFLRIRYVLYINFAMYLMFYILLMNYIWHLTNDIPEPIGDFVSNWKNWPVLSTFLMLSLVLMLLREVLQFLAAPVSYFAGPGNWLELLLLVAVLSVLFGAGREVSALTILLSTWELVVLIAQHPRMSTDIEMFKTVTINFVKFLFLYLFLILAFAVAFFVLFKGDTNFGDPLKSIFKTITMLTGELDSGNLHFEYYPIVSRLVFVSFVFLIVIILLNLLNGLAVNDTGKILDQAELVGLISRVELIAYAERLAFGSPFNQSRKICFGISLRPLQTLLSKPLRFLANQILIFPRFLPEARLGIKPLKSHAVTLYKRSLSAKRRTILTMDPNITQKAKDVLESKTQETVTDKILREIHHLRKAVQQLQGIVANQTFIGELDE